MAPNGMLPRCANCQSLERHRMFRIMFERLGVGGFADMRAIQFSPDPTIDPSWFKSFELSVYGEGEGLDIQSIDRPDGAYDFVACSHVLEHVADDRQALHELLRITADDGLLSSSCPIRFARRRRATGVLRSRKSTATFASMAPTLPSAFRATYRTSRSSPIWGKTR